MVTDHLNYTSGMVGWYKVDVHNVGIKIIARCRQYLQTIGPNVDIICLLGSLLKCPLLRSP